MTDSTNIAELFASAWTRHLISRFRFAFASLAFAAASTLAAAEFRGRLNPEVQPGTRSGGYLQKATADAVALLPELPPPTATVWAPRQPVSIKGATYATLLVSSPRSSVVLWFDRDRDGRFSPGERWSFPGPDAPVAISLPWDNGIYRQFPLQVFYSPPPQDPAAKRGPGETAEPRTLTYNFNFLASGTVDIDGKPLMFTFAPRPAEVALNLLTSRISVDGNFNGRYEADLGEMENPSGRLPVFRVGSRYLAPKSVDMLTGEVVFEERPASDYTRFDANPGQLMPDFDFVDLDGRKRRLSDYRGKYVLLDFWGTWCGPCIAEMKHLDPIYAKYGPRGFEVIGMIMEKTSGGLTPEQYAADLEKVRTFIAKAGHRWVQATQQSIERVAIDVIHVNAYPTCILLDPEGRVLSRRARGQELADLLAKYLP
ncbi:MAG: TlpA family protein disulfide reductase [Opitutaceae bacterium]|jgi:thiol-disulfide isomerase/thioredoxin|nr:TlpA family protein disulfide reductase [Opitutaceae bacterium]